MEIYGYKIGNMYFIETWMNGEIIEYVETEDGHQLYVER